MQLGNGRTLKTGAMLALVAATCVAQSTAPKAVPAKAAKKVSAASMPQANLNQLMRGIFYPNSNVIFFAQAKDPAAVPPSKESSTATDPLQNAYGQWQSVENSALALVEGANLLSLQGRKCSNGRVAPITNADWPKFVQALRDAGMLAYKAAQSKNQDNILDAADAMTTACANCHDKYREKPKLADRCI
jgi:hypothetical protein